jgi:hypothetical protein
MAATVYDPPQELKVPEFSFENFNYEEHQKKNNKYLEDLKAFLVKLGYTSKWCGETIKFPRGDGHAVYMVAGLKPLTLVHIPLDDAWHYPEAHLLTASYVKDIIEKEKRFNENWKKS